MLCLLQASRGQSRVTSLAACVVGLCSLLQRARESKAVSLLLTCITGVNLCNPVPEVQATSTTRVSILEHSGSWRLFNPCSWGKIGCYAHGASVSLHLLIMKVYSASTIHHPRCSSLAFTRTGACEATIVLHTWNQTKRSG